MSFCVRCRSVEFRCDTGVVEIMGWFDVRHDDSRVGLGKTLEDELVLDRSDGRKPRGKLVA